MNVRAQSLLPSCNLLSQDGDGLVFFLLPYEDGVLVHDDGSLLCDVLLRDASPHDDGAHLCDVFLRDALPHDDVALFLVENRTQFRDVSHDALVLDSYSISHPGIIQELVLDARILGLPRIHKLVYQTVRNEICGANQGCEPCDEVCDDEFLLDH